MKFKVGDIVAYNDNAGHLILLREKPFKERIKFGCRGIITAIHEDYLHVGEFYSVSWFGNGNSVNEVMELNLCDGVKNPQLCDNCKDKIECQSHPETCQDCRESGGWVY